MAPFPEFTDDEDEKDDGAADRRTKTRVINVRLLPIVWVWVRYEARRACLRPSEWIRRALADYEESGGDDEARKGKILNVRVDEDEWQRIKRAALSSKRKPSDCVRQAINAALNKAGE